MASSLPDSPSLEKLRGLARALQRACRRGDQDALQRLAELHPRAEIAAQQRFPLAAAQLVLARSYGFPGWPALRGYLEVAAGLTRTPLQHEDRMTPTEQFCSLACLRYDSHDGPYRWASATRMLSPDQDFWDLATACAAADPDAVAALLDKDPGAATRLIGPHRWSPLLYVTYSRVSGADPIAVANALLDAGADPNAGFLWSGLATPFTALTGVFGEGEMGAGRQPAHPQWRELATLLLERGAEANDAQTLYNRMFRRGSDHLELLFAYGLGVGDGGPWRRQLGDATESVAEMMQRQVDWSLTHGMVDRLELLAQHGFGPGPDGISADVARNGGIVQAGRTALHEAAWDGDLERIRELLTSGADPQAGDAEHHTTPREWAEFAFQDAAATLLREWEDGHQP